MSEPEVRHLRVVRARRARQLRQATAAAGRPLRERLGALEREIDAALAADALPGAAGLRALDVALDELLAAFASLRRGIGAEAVGATVLRGLYRLWWRVDAVGIERVPAHGRVLLVVNRAGVLLPYEALMVAMALALDHPTGRNAWPLVDDWVVRLRLGRTLGALGATPGVMRRLLERDEAVIVLPEGREASGKSRRRRYRLGGFGRGSFARIAIETGAPIVPVAAVGAEESQPVLWRLDALGRWLGLPTLPITPTFPWLGPAGLVPLPAKWTLHVGEPLDVAAHHSPDAARDPRVVALVRDQVRERLQALVSEGVRRRHAIFFA